MSQTELNCASPVTAENKSAQPEEYVSLDAASLEPWLDAAMLARFGFVGECQVTPFGNGHINRTYLVKQGDARLILQQINTQVFPSAAAVVENARHIEAHLLAKQAMGQYSMHVLRHQATSDGVWLVGPAQDVRALTFIAGGRSLEVVNSRQQAFAAAKSFGQFAAALADFPAQQLHTVLPGFHDLARRMSQLKAAVAADSHGRLAQCKDLVDFCLVQQPLLETLAQTCQQLPLRVCHNDTKINNMLYSDAEGVGLAVIDLDTCMPGYWMFDFGDMVRTCCSPVAEDSQQHDQVHIRTEIFQALVQGYQQGLGSQLTQAEQDSFYLGAKVMCLMIGVRFLTDHLQGDNYFQIKRLHHNLDRARNQLALYADLQQREAQLRRFFVE